MKGDFSRLTFAEKNHYRRVLMQQGRVEIDADGNEQIAIDDHIAAVTTTDVIGSAGYPVGLLPNGNPAGGFELGLNAAGSDLTISAGRMYVEGVLVENEAPASVLNQPGMPGVTLADFGVTGTGIYLAYLDVWERLITALDNPAIQETALGGPDTSVRSQVVWQVKLALIENTSVTPTTLPTCAGIGDPWLAKASTGMLAAGSATPGTSLPCILPPETGYQRLENQLYRVEIDNPGHDGTATFKWSRENGSVVALISTPSTSSATTVTGPLFWVTSLSDDPTLGLQAGDWVELTDDSTELIDGNGSLYQVALTPSDGHWVQLQPTATETVTLAMHPKLRRWDQPGGGPSTLPVTSGSWVPLEGGVQVVFAAGYYNTGDYWLIPARTATSIQQGFVEWPVDASSNPVPEPPLGIRHRYAKLGMVGFTEPGSFTHPTDCRLPFPPLTALIPQQSLSPCTIVVQPGPNWQQPINTYFQNAGENVLLDAEICFPIGNFPVTTPLVIANAGHIRITGAGWGTKLVAATDDAAAESVLQFVNCQSVSVNDLYGETSMVNTGGGGIIGTLSFSDCPEVSVEDVSLRCGSAVSHRGAACINVSSTATSGNTATGAGSTRIRGCQLYVGEMQVGIQLVHQARATVEDNEITVDPNVPSTNTLVRFADVGYRAIARRSLISQAQPTPKVAVGAAVKGAPAVAAAGEAVTEERQLAAPAAPAAPEPAAPAAPEPAAPAAPEPAAPPPAPPGAVDESIRQTVRIPAVAAPAAAPAAESQPLTEKVASPTVGLGIATLVGADRLQLKVGTQTLSLVTTGALASTWQAYINEKAPKTFATATDARTFVKKTANLLLTTPAARAGFSGFSGALQFFRGHVPLAARGIVVGGQSIGDLHILNNAISGVIMGISVGVSHRASPAEARAKQRGHDAMQTISISGNVIACNTNDVASAYARFGIFVGNANSLEIEGNRITVSPTGTSATPTADGIRVVGFLGIKAVLRHNHVTSFAMGIRVVALTGRGAGTPVVVTVRPEYLSTIRAGELWLVADNVIEGVSDANVKLPPFGPFRKVRSGRPLPYIDAPTCLLVNNVHS